MIRYELVCAAAHRFEAWFPDSAGYDEQEARGLLVCPLCGDREIRKAPMAPAVRRSREAATRPGERGSPTPQAPTDAQAERLAAMLRTLRAIRRHVEENFEDVGERFPEEARRMHYGETEPRDIYGQASREEVRELLEEGITILPLPRLPDHDA